MLFRSPLLERGSQIPAIITSILVLIFMLWALYAFSGARLIHRFPLLRTALILIGGIYTLRGMQTFVDFFSLLSGRHPEPRMITFSLVSLVLGVFHLIGTWRAVKSGSI